MANTYTLISSNTLTSSAASVTFSSIPATYTDLVVKYSVRGDIAGTNSLQTGLQLNGVTSGYSQTYMYGNGASAVSSRATSQVAIETVGENSTGNTASTFSSGEIYIPNYQSTTNKPLSMFIAPENNGTTTYLSAHAGLSSVTSAITSITLKTNANNFISGSSFYLYGIKNS